MTDLRDQHTIEGWQVRSQVDSQDKRSGVFQWPAAVTFGGNGATKGQVVHKLKQSEHWPPQDQHQRDKLLDMLCSMYSPVPAHNHGWSSLTGVRPECQCPWHLNESTRHRRPVWCVHTGALMYRLAYQVNDSRDMLAGLHGFELRGDRPLPPPVIELSDSSDNNTDSTNNRAKRPRGAGPAAPSKWIML